MAVSKYLNRICAPADLPKGKKVEIWDKNTAEALHDHTYGIHSDPLTHFACLFSALIHDLDHPGVPNVRFVQENPSLSARYKNRSVAEQNSFDLAWSLLMEPGCDGLREYIFESQGELERFRQLVINCVMASK